MGRGGGLTYKWKGSVTFEGEESNKESFKQHGSIITLNY